MPPTSHAAEDWTTGPAKWVAVIVLGGASMWGMAWSIVTRPPARLAQDHTPAVIEIAPDPSAASSDAGRVRGAKPAAPTTASAAKRININSAAASELELLPRIGPALAARIVEYRAANGPFRAVDDLVNVKGIGPLTLEKLRPLVTVD